VVTLTAATETGWLFAGWSGDLSGNSSPTPLTMDGDKTVTATFELEPVPIIQVDIVVVPTLPRVGQPVLLIAVVTGGTAPLTYVWDFGDGVQVITDTETVLHSFPSSSTLQTYTVTLTASDSLTSHQARKPVSIRPFTVYLPIVLRMARP
jgi:uncharacterized repeat protein (TIGR02543 family)